jgi:threonine dehydratase
VFLAFEVDAREEAGDILKAIEQKGPGWQGIDITDNELAKTHARYMVGGRSSTVGQEILYRFRFPALAESMLLVLQSIKKWNLSLFHCISID